MSAWNELTAWREEVDRRLAALENPNAYPAAARKRDDQLADSIDRAALWSPPTRLGDVAATTTFVVYLATGAERLTGAVAQNGDDLAFDGTNYWTFALLVRRAAVAPFAADADGTTIGTQSTLTNVGIALVSQTNFSLYTSVAGLAMAAGDSLVLVLTKTGAPADLVDFTFWPTIQRITR